jgi:hypothetical protein
MNNIESRILEIERRIGKMIDRIGVLPIKFRKFWGKKRIIFIDSGYNTTKIKKELLEYLKKNKTGIRIIRIVHFDGSKQEHKAQILH